MKWRWMLVVAALALNAEAQVTGGSFGGSRWGSGGTEAQSPAPMQRPPEWDRPSRPERSGGEPDPFPGVQQPRHERASSASEAHEVKPFPQWFKTTVLVVLALAGLALLVFVGRIFYEMW